MPAPNYEDTIKQIEEQDTNWELLCKSLSAFLSRAFPTAASEACDLSKCLLVLVTTGSKRQIESMRRAHENYGPKPEHMFSLIEQRDRLTEQLEQAERGLESFRESSEGNEGLADIMSAGAVIPLKQALAGINDQISHLQSQLEKKEESRGS